MTCAYTGIWKWFYDWQTIIAGVTALAAAWVAARPVWQQLRASSRDVLDARVAATESRRNTVRQRMTRFMSQLRPYGDDREVEPHSEWALEAEKEIDNVIETLAMQQETSFDGGVVDSQRAATIRECRALSNCLFEIRAPYTADFGGPDAPSEDEEPAFVERAKHAARELENRISAVSKAANALDDAFAARLNQLRERIRGIDRRAGI